MCCGTEDACDDTDVIYDGQTRRREALASVPRVADMAEIKRAPLLSRAFDKRNITNTNTTTTNNNSSSSSSSSIHTSNKSAGSCKFVKDSGTEVVFGRQKKMSEILPCRIGSGSCGLDYSYTVGTEITDSVNVQVTVGVEFFEMVTSEISVGYDHSSSRQQSFTATTHLGPSPGHYGYVTFRPKYVCARGHTEGDCSHETLEPLKGRKWCLPKTLPDGRFDGNWDVVEVD
ncbi:hypothetical protein PG984_003484 [Apiospora sp. TS-2023a]